MILTLFFSVVWGASIVAAGVIAANGTGDPRKTFADVDRCRFLRALDDAVQIDLPDDETNFIGSIYGQLNFTEHQRAELDRLIEKYGARIGF